jgi:hypothetical protein
VLIVPGGDRAQEQTRSRHIEPSWELCRQISDIEFITTTTIIITLPMCYIMQAGHRIGCSGCLGRKQPTPQRNNLIVGWFQRIVPVKTQAFCLASPHAPCVFTGKMHLYA